tara:strand:+ start:425 stop:526 length:102 start_codon:yes stop_codon:yes gene_type:complete
MDEQLAKEIKNTIATAIIKFFAPSMMTVPVDIP